MLHTIDTERLRIRRLTSEDLDEISAILDACFGVIPAEDRKFWLTWQIMSYEVHERMNQPPYGDYALETRDGILVGSVGLVQSFGPFESLRAIAGEDATPDAPNTPEVGMFWAIGPQHRRKGYAAEAASALAGWAFTQMQIARLVATTEHDNAASLAVMRKLDMTIEHADERTPEWFQATGVLTLDAYKASSTSSE